MLALPWCKRATQHLHLHPRVPLACEPSSRQTSAMKTSLETLAGTTTSFMATLVGTRAFPSSLSRSGTNPRPRWSPPRSPCQSWRWMHPWALARRSSPTPRAPPPPTMSQVTQGHPINWDMNLPLKPRARSPSMPWDMQQNLPIKLKHEGDVRRAAARSSAAASSSTHGPPSVDQQLQSTMYKVFYWPAYLKSASASVKEDLQRSCCMEWSKAHVKKASGISALPSGYLMVTLGYHVHQHQHQEQEQDQEQDQEQQQQQQLEPPIRIREMAHRLVCWSRYGPPPLDREVSHTCNNKRCLNPWHLKWETHSATIMRRRGTGTGVEGFRVYTFRDLGCTNYR